MRKKIYSGIAGTIVAAIIAAAVAIYSPSDALEIKITAPTTISVGKIAVIDVSATEADSYAWSVSPASEVLIFENGQKLAFAHYQPGQYLFIVAAAKDGQVGLREHIIEVTGGPGPPGPETFTDRVKRWSEQVQSRNKKAEMLALSGNFSSIASAIAAGAFKEPEKIVATTADMNKQALGENAKAWDPFFQSLRAELNARSQAGTLSTLDEHATLWREIAAALR